jgi:preprotein translocase subunit SecD
VCSSDLFGSDVQISGEFTESEARALARAINAGTLSVQLVVESVTVTG